MNYYFDESGNWSGRENHRLLIGGLLLKNGDIEKKLQREFKILQAENQVATLHANELTDNIREFCYRIIDKYLTRETAVLVRIYPKNIVRSRTTENPEAIYSDCAAELVRTMTFGDQEIKIFYDLKFHYAYPVNIIRNLKASRPRYYKSMKKNFTLVDESFLKNRNRIVNKLQAQLNKRGISAGDKRCLEEFIVKVTDTTITLDCLDPAVAHKLEEGREKVKIEIANYLWSELWLLIEGTEQAREKFRSKILAKTEATRKLLSIDKDLPRLALRFFGKQENNAGVTAIDFICNLVYRYGRTPPANASNSVKSIYSKIALEEIR